MTTSPLINVMSAAAIKAGKGLVRDFGEVSELQISRKGASNFVTSADLRTEKLLQKELSKARPEFGFLLEEGGEIEGNGPYRWIIDPLDGTSNFIHAIPYFCISIALEKREGGKSHIMAGVIYDPIHNELFSAEQYKGAFLNGRRINVSSRNSFDTALLVTGNPRPLAGADKRAFDTLANVAANGTTIRVMGATALDLANLAAGRIDACWYHSMQPWDVAAGLLLITEAGAHSSDFSGKPLTAYSPSVIASTPALAPALTKLLTRSAA